MIRIPNKNKQFSVDNASFSRGNIYSTWNVMFDADIGKIKLNPPLLHSYFTSGGNGFSNPIAIVVAPTDFSDRGAVTDGYILTDDGAGFGGVWKTSGGLGQITQTNSPSKATDATSDMCLYLGAQSTEKIYVSDADGLHNCKPANSNDTWVALDGSTTSATASKNAFILIPFTYNNRLYMIPSTANAIYSIQETSDGTFSVPVSNGSSFSINTGLSGITCGRASSKRIWFASSSSNTGKSKVYEWDGVQANLPLNVYNIDVPLIQSIAILNDTPVCIDGRGRLWFFDGYQFVLKSGINFPSREDNVEQTCTVHRNGMITDKGKLYVNIGNVSSTMYRNSTERSLAGVWCYDPAIGFYHFSSPENISRVTAPYCLARWVADQTFAVGFKGTTGSVTDTVYNVAVTNTDETLGGTLRLGFLTTQFMESQNLTDMWNSVGIKYRDMIYASAKVEVKYRFKKNIECNTTITWTSATTFTCPTANLAGSGFYYNTQVVVGDEVMVQQGVNSGLIAHITTMVDGGTDTTVTIDRSATTTSGTSYAMFSNYALLGTITKDGDTFKNFRLAKKSTMIQVKLVMSWVGYYDEIQEILLSEQKQDSTI